MTLMKKKIDFENSDVLYHEQFTGDTLPEGWKVHGGQWWMQDGWLNGRNPDNCPGMIVYHHNFYGNVLLEFEARTVLPCTHDIDVMWNGSWDEEKNQRDVAYVAGLAGWWENKVGIEKSPDYALNAATPLFHFEPGRTYFIQCGSIDGHCFVYIDRKLVLEVTDPSPIDTTKYGKVGFEAYCSSIQVRNLTVRQINWQPHELSYIYEG